MMRQRKSKRKTIRQQRGMAMALTLLVLLSVMGMVILGLLAGTGNGTTAPNSAGGMGAVSDSGLRFAADIGRETCALNLADAGVQDTILWLSAQSAPPSQTVAFAPSAASFSLPLWGAGTLATSPPRAVVNYPLYPGDQNDTFSITLYPASGNAGNSQKSFLIESIGTSYGFKQIVHAYVTQTSFASYCSFESDASGGGTWDSSFIQFDGPVHFNSAAYLNLNWNDGGQPIFNYNGPDAFTSSFTLGWQHNWQTVSSPPAANDTAGWNALSPYGATSIKMNQDRVNLPTTTADQAIQKTACLGTLSSPPTSTIGATVCPSGGIYIHGDIQQMTLSVSPSNSATQIIELYQIDPSSGAKKYEKITLDATLNQTSIQTGTFTSSGTITLNSSSTWPAASAGLTNGVIYCDGSIGGTTQYAEGGIKGVIADNAYSGSTLTHSNALTIATSPTNDVQVDGSLVVNTPRQIQQDSNGNYEFQDCHGNTITSSSSSTPSGTTPIYVSESSDTGQFKTKAGRLGIVTHQFAYGTYTFNSTGQVCTGYLSSLELDAAQFMYASEGGTPYSYTSPGLAYENMGSDTHATGSSNWPTPTHSRACWDERLTDNPPPFFPTTSNRYKLISWQRVSSVIEGTP